MLAANFQPSWPSRGSNQRHISEGVCFLKLLGGGQFFFYEIFVGSTSSEVQHPWISKIRCEPKKSQKIIFQAQF